MIIKENPMMISIVTEKSFDEIKQLLTKGNKMSLMSLKIKKSYEQKCSSLTLQKKNLTTTENSIINSEVRVIP